ncbi:MAG: MASE1 domain-containing protein, partial [Massilia sp.]
MGRPARLVRLCAEITLLALLYYFGARCGLLLAFADTNATPVWPPSGLAVGALVLFGMRLWPGILLGALAANLAVFSAHHGAITPQFVFVSLGIACGNTLEALSGAWLLR